MNLVNTLRYDTHFKNQMHEYTAWGDSLCSGKETIPIGHYDSWREESEINPIPKIKTISPIDIGRKTHYISHDKQLINT